MKNYLKLGILFIGILLFQNCSESTDEVETSQLKSQISLQPEEAYPNYVGEIVTVTYRGIDVQVMKHGEQFIFEGDIVLTQKDLDEYNSNSFSKPTSAVESGSSYRWSNRTVYYTINGSLTSQYRVTDAIAHWEANTTLSFVQRTTQNNYIEFVSAGPGECYSNSIGKKGGRQEIGLGSGCSTGNAIHEIGHAIGLFHEQTRKDRDNYIQIHYNNILPGKSNNFDKYTTRTSTGQDIGAFDFGSIMMYGSYSFTNNGQPTITKLDGTTFGIQRVGLSSIDMEGVYYLYPAPPPPSLTVNISGPIFGNNTSYYTWTANVSDGTPPYTYSWKRSSDQGQTYPYPWGYGGSSFTVQMPLDQDLYIKVIVTDSNGVTGEDYWITENNGSGGIHP